MTIQQTIEFKENNEAIPSRKQVLKVILRTLNEDGNYQKSILLDSSGMTVSEDGDINIDKAALPAMFALILNSVERLTSNLNIPPLDTAVIIAGSWEFISSSFSIPNYNRQLILVCVKPKNSQIAYSRQHAAPRVQNIFPFKISIFQLLKLFISNRLLRNNLETSIRTTLCNCAPVRISIQHNENAYKDNLLNPVKEDTDLPFKHAIQKVIYAFRNSF